MSSPRIALVTCADLPDLNDEDLPLVDALRRKGAQAVATVWDDPAVDWDSFDLCVLRSTADYTERFEEFMAWADSVPRLVNPPNVLRWNCDKHYLQQLRDHGLRVIDTQWMEPERAFDKRALHNRFPAREDFVIKPAVSAGTKDAGRYTATDADSRRYAIEHAFRLLQQGRSVMVQRYIPEVDSVGESALIFLHGTYSHSVHKDAMLKLGTTPDQDIERYRPERMSSHQATPEEIEAAQNILAFARARIPGRSTASRPLLYARVDMVTPSSGKPLLMELELVEPSLFCSMAPGALDRFADAILAEVRMGVDPDNMAMA
ncbi:MAG: RimK family alpha-L-glutamate ligase [Beutenbergiaceae bacterium]